VWLWIYVLSIPISRLLLRMNNGVGFLLRVTDVEKQPFRSMGFVSVIIVSGLFFLALTMMLGPRTEPQRCWSVIVSVIERKLCKAIDKLIVVAIRMHPELAGALRSVQSVLLEISG
jgi:hypothetical protein